MSLFRKAGREGKSAQDARGFLRMYRRLWQLPLVLGVSLAVVPATSAAAPALPNLRMAKLRDIQIQKQSNGARWLRYTTIMVNLGAGPFEVTGANLQSTQTVTQTVYNADRTVSGSTVLNTSMFYAGDGHNHWHLKNMETGALTGNGQKRRTLMKTGYCFSDNVQFNLSLPGAPASPKYTNCGDNNPAATTVTMGLSVGWGDVYPWSIAFQYIDISNLPGGLYTLTGCANANLGVVESNSSDNCATQNVRLKSNGTSVSLVGTPTGA